ncbi:hypothetical protein V8E36_007114 [Tilletia maclaganii]
MSANPQGRTMSSSIGYSKQQPIESSSGGGSYSHSLSFMATPSPRYNHSSAGSWAQHHHPHHNAAAAANTSAASATSSASASLQQSYSSYPSRQILPLASQSASNARNDPASEQYFITVLPPPEFPMDSVAARRGTLVPLYPTLSGQLSAIARELSLPSTGGIALYLLDDGEGNPGPKVGDRSWTTLFKRHFEEEEAERIARAAASAGDDLSELQSLGSTRVGGYDTTWPRRSIKRTGPSAAGSSAADLGLRSSVEAPSTGPNTSSITTSPTHQSLTQSSVSAEEGNEEEEEEHLAETINEHASQAFADADETGLSSGVSATSGPDFENVNGGSVSTSFDGSFQARVPQVARNGQLRNGSLSTRRNLGGNMNTNFAATRQENSSTSAYNLLDARSANLRDHGSNRSVRQSQSSRGGPGIPARNQVPEYSGSESQYSPIPGHHTDAGSRNSSMSLNRAQQQQNAAIDGLPRASGNGGTHSPRASLYQSQSRARNRFNPSISASSIAALGGASGGLWLSIVARFEWTIERSRPAASWWDMWCERERARIARISSGASQHFAGSRWVGSLGSQTYISPLMASAATFSRTGTADYPGEAVPSQQVQLQQHPTPTQVIDTPVAAWNPMLNRHVMDDRSPRDTRSVSGLGVGVPATPQAGLAPASAAGIATLAGAGAAMLNALSPRTPEAPASRRAADLDEHAVGPPAEIVGAPSVPIGLLQHAPHSAPPPNTAIGSAAVVAASLAAAAAGAGEALNRAVHDGPREEDVVPLSRSVRESLQTREHLQSQPQQLFVFPPTPPVALAKAGSSATTPIAEPRAAPAPLELPTDSALAAAHKHEDVAAPVATADKVAVPPIVEADGPTSDMPVPFVVEGDTEPAIAPEPSEGAAVEAVPEIGNPTSREAVDHDEVDNLAHEQTQATAASADAYSEHAVEALDSAPQSTASEDAPAPLRDDEQLIASSMTPAFSTPVSEAVAEFLPTAVQDSSDLQQPADDSDFSGSSEAGADDVVIASALDKINDASEIRRVSQEESFPEPSQATDSIVPEVETAPTTSRSMDISDVETTEHERLQIIPEGGLLPAAEEPQGAPPPEVDSSEQPAHAQDDASEPPAPQRDNAAPELPVAGTESEASPTLVIAEPGESSAPPSSSASDGQRQSISSSSAGSSSDRELVLQQRQQAREALRLRMEQEQAQSLHVTSKSVIADISAESYATPTEEVKDVLQDSEPTERLQRSGSLLQADAVEQHADEVEAALRQMQTDDVDIQRETMPLIAAAHDVLGPPPASISAEDAFHQTLVPGGAIATVQASAADDVDILAIQPALPTHSFEVGDVVPFRDIEVPTEDEALETAPHEVPTGPSSVAHVIADTAAGVPLHESPEAFRAISLPTGDGQARATEVGQATAPQREDNTQPLRFGPTVEITMGGERPIAHEPVAPAVQAQARQSIASSGWTVEPSSSVQAAGHAEREISPDRFSSPNQRPRREPPPPPPSAHRTVSSSPRYVAPSLLPPHSEALLDLASHVATRSSVVSIESIGIPRTTSEDFFGNAEATPQDVLPVSSTSALPISHQVLTDETGAERMERKRDETLAALEGEQDDEQISRDATTRASAAVVTAEEEPTLLMQHVLGLFGASGETQPLSQAPTQEETHPAESPASAHADNASVDEESEEESARKEVRREAAAIDAAQPLVLPVTSDVEAQVQSATVEDTTEMPTPLATRLVNPIDSSVIAAETSPGVVAADLGSQTSGVLSPPPSQPTSLSYMSDLTDRPASLLSVQSNQSDSTLRASQIGPRFEADNESVTTITSTNEPLATPRAPVPPTRSVPPPPVPPRNAPDLPARPAAADTSSGEHADNTTKALPPPVPPRPTPKLSDPFASIGLRLQEDDGLASPMDARPKPSRPYLRDGDDYFGKPQPQSHFSDDDDAGEVPGVAEEEEEDSDSSGENTPIHEDADEDEESAAARRNAAIEARLAARNQDRGWSFRPTRKIFGFSFNRRRKSPFATNDEDLERQDGEEEAEDSSSDDDVEDQQEDVDGVEQVPGQATKSGEAEVPPSRDDALSDIPPLARSNETSVPIVTAVTEQGSAAPKPIAEDVRDTHAPREAVAPVQDGDFAARFAPTPSPAAQSEIGSGAADNISSGTSPDAAQGSSQSRPGIPEDAYSTLVADPTHPFPVSVPAPPARPPPPPPALLNSGPVPETAELGPQAQSFDSTAAQAESQRAVGTKADPAADSVAHQEDEDALEVNEEEESSSDTEPGREISDGDEADAARRDAAITSRLEARNKDRGWTYRPTRLFNFGLGRKKSSDGSRSARQPAFFGLLGNRDDGGDEAANEDDDSSSDEFEEDEGEIEEVGTKDEGSAAAGESEPTKPTHPEQPVAATAAESAIASAPSEQSSPIEVAEEPSRSESETTSDKGQDTEGSITQVETVSTSETELTPRLVNKDEDKHARFSSPPPNEVTPQQHDQYRQRVYSHFSDDEDEDASEFSDPELEPRRRASEVPEDAVTDEDHDATFVHAGERAEHSDGGTDDDRHDDSTDHLQDSEIEHAFEALRVPGGFAPFNDFSDDESQHRGLFDGDSAEYHGRAESSQDHGHRHSLVHEGGDIDGDSHHEDAFSLENEVRNSLGSIPGHDGSRIGPPSLSLSLSPQRQSRPLSGQTRGGDSAFGDDDGASGRMYLEVQSESDHVWTPGADGTPFEFDDGTGTLSVDEHQTEDDGDRTFQGAELHSGVHPADPDRQFPETEVGAQSGGHVSSLSQQYHIVDHPSLASSVDSFGTTFSQLPPTTPDAYDAPHSSHNPYAGEASGVNANETAAWNVQRQQQYSGDGNVRAGGHRAFGSGASGEHYAPLQRSGRFDSMSSNEHFDSPTSHLSVSS